MPSTNTVRVLELEPGDWFCDDPANGVFEVAEVSTVGDLVIIRPTIGQPMPLDADTTVEVRK